MKTFRTILLSISLLNIFQLCGQDNAFFRKYSTVGNDAAYGVVEVEDGFIIGGNSNSDIHPEFSNDAPAIYLMKVDSIGNKQWEKYYRVADRSVIGFSSNQGQHQNNSMLRSKDGNIVCFGEGMVIGLLSPIIIKIDLNGDTLWTYTDFPDTSGIIEDNWSIQGIEDDEGNILVLCRSLPLNSRAYRTKNLLIKINSKGKLLWRKSIDIKFRIFTRMAHIPSKKQYVLFGNLYSHESYNLPPQTKISDTASALIIDQNGNILEDKILFFDNYPDNDAGSYYFSQTKTQGNTVIAGFENNDNREFVYLDDQLETIYVKTFKDNSFTSLTENYNGFKYYSVDTGIIFTDSNYSPIFIYQIPNYYVEYTSIVNELCMQHSGCYAVGFVENKDASNHFIEPNSSDIIFLRTNQSGFSTYPGYPNTITLFPNPANSFTYISYTLKSTGAFKLRVYDTNGRLVETLEDAEKIEGNYILTMQTNGYKSGIYFIRLETPDGNSNVKLLIH